MSASLNQDSLGRLSKSLGICAASTYWGLRKFHGYTCVDALALARKQAADLGIDYEGFDCVRYRNPHHPQFVLGHQQP